MNKNTDPKFYRNDLLLAAWQLKGFTFRAFADTTGIAAGTVRAALNGESMQIAKLKEFADALSVKWLHLFDLENAFAPASGDYYIEPETLGGDLYFMIYRKNYGFFERWNTLETASARLNELINKKGK